MTTESSSPTMTAEAQRIAITESCGWKRGLHEPNMPPFWTHESSGFTKHRVGDLPDYLNDLNAMHEAEKALEDRQHYIEILEGVCAGTPQWDRISATAAQRAESFLKTLNLWKPTP